MQFHPSPELFRLLGGVLCFLTAVLLWSALGINEYVVNHMLLTFTWQNNVVSTDQEFSVGAFYLCSSLSFSYNGAFVASTPTSCASIGDDCASYLQLQDPSGDDVYESPIRLQMRKRCSTFIFGRFCLVVAALAFTLTSAVMAFLPCSPLQRLVARWGALKVDRALVVEAVVATAFALASILCQPDNASDEFDDSAACDDAYAQAKADLVQLTDCQTPTSTWGASFDCHAVAIVLGALGVAFYAGAWRMQSKAELHQPLVDGDRGEVGGVSGGRDSEDWEGANHHSYPG